MRKNLKMICIVTALAIAFAVPVHAKEVETRSSAYISAYDSALVAGTGPELHIWFNVLGSGRMDEIGASEIKVQRSPTGTGDWTTVKIFTKADYPQMVCQDTGYHNTHVTYYGLTGHYYRAIVTVYAAKGNGAGYLVDYAEVIYLSPI